MSESNPEIDYKNLYRANLPLGVTFNPINANYYYNGQRFNNITPVEFYRNYLFATMGFTASPLALFAAGEQGVWYDPSQAANLDWRRNLLTFTEQFDNAAWAKNGAALTVVANASSAPDGSVTADRVSGSSSFESVQQVVTSTSGAAHTMSVYVSNSDRGLVTLRMASGSNDVRKIINLSTGGVTDGGGNGTGFLSAGVVSSGDFYRVYLSVTSGGTSITANIYPDDISQNRVHTIDVWGAQLELGSTATEYQRITDVNTEVMERFPEATLFQDTAGTTPVTTAGQTVGLMLDKSQGLVLGPELVPSSFASWLTDAPSDTTVTESSGVITLTVNTAGNGYPRASAPISCVVGETYIVDVSWANNTTGFWAKIGGAANLGGTDIKVNDTGSSGSHTLTFVATSATHYLNIFAESNNTGSVDVTIASQSVKLLAGNHATQATAAARPSYIVDADGIFIQHDLVDDALTVTLPDMGTEATVAYVTRSEVRLLEDQTISGSYTLPTQEIAGFIAVDRALTQAEKINVIRYLASKVEGVNYGAEIDRLTLIAINAVDVFVYDTSKDSDGGAWRYGALAQASSWYNETLNTATRGSRREFPAVAVIVAEAGKVTIYDGDDPALPMWMVFDHKSFAGMLFEGSTSPKSLFALNGQVACGDTAFDLQVVNFISDLGVTYSTTNLISGTFKFPISGRNSGPITTPADSWIFGTVPNIVNRTVNDVAMTVLPNAPIDPATGLPVPTIAVATAGGVSVIKDDGTVVSDNHPVTVQRVGILGEDLFSYVQTSIGYVAVRRNFYTRTGVSVDNFGLSSGGEVFYRHNSVPALFPTQANNAILKFDSKDFGFNQGLFRLHEDPATPSKGMVAYTTSTYNTGWMNGDIKGVFLSDTDDTDLVGSTYINDDFSGYADTAALQAAWVPQGSTVTSLISGAMSITRSQEFCVRIPIGQVLPTGTVVTVEWEVTSNTSSGYAYFGFDGATDITPKTGAYGVVGKHSASVKLSSDRGSFDIYLGGVSAFEIALDNISVKLADADRSVNNKGLIVNGTVTRSPVATGADLVAYSGFSSSNYLEQPYNSDLDFGTGDFSIMGWVRPITFNSRQSYLVDRGGNKMGLRLNFSTGALTAFCDAANYVSPLVFSVNSWQFFVWVRSSGVSSFYRDGVLGATTGTLSGSVDDTSGLLLGRRSSPATDFFDGSLALLRVSATAPTAEQIAKIYNDERVLFEPNAQATLYGASNAVTALAHDPDTDLLHVGTSAGRSVFEGLRRVGNTTTSVSTSISASGGLIVEK